MRCFDLISEIAKCENSGETNRGILGPEQLPADRLRRDHRVSLN